MNVHRTNVHNIQTQARISASHMSGFKIKPEIFEIENTHSIRLQAKRLQTMEYIIGTIGETVYSSFCKHLQPNA